MEQFDVLDKYGASTGKIKEKGAHLREGEYYLGVHAYIHSSRQEYLLQQRAFSKDFLPGGWDIHMGHVMAGETSEEAILREIGEEIGLSCNPGSLHRIGRIIWEQYHHMIDVYVIETEFDIDELVVQEDEVIDIAKVTKEEMIAIVNGMDYRPKEYRHIILEYLCAC